MCGQQNEERQGRRRAWIFGRRGMAVAWAGRGGGMAAAGGEAGGARAENFKNTTDPGLT